MCSILELGVRLHNWNWRKRRMLLHINLLSMDVYAMVLDLILS